jgi:hypothetical protein
LRVEVELTFDSGFADAVEFTFDVTNLVGAPVNPVIAPADVNGHAQISATFSAAEMPGPLVQISYQWDGNYTDGDWNIDESGTLDFDSMVGPTLELGLRFYPELPGWVFDNGWHNAVMMAYANDYRPDLSAAAGDCGTNPPCLQINGLAGINNDKISLLMLAGEHNWVDGDINPAVPADGTFANEVGDVFNLENSNLDSTFDIRTVEATAAPGDTQLDKILVIK